MTYRYTERDARAAVLRLAASYGLGYVPSGKLPSGEDDKTYARELGVPIHEFQRGTTATGENVSGYWPKENSHADQNGRKALCLEHAASGGYRIAVHSQYSSGTGNLAFPSSLSSRDLCTAVRIAEDLLRIGESL